MLLVRKLDGDFFIPKPKTISKGNWQTFAFVLSHDDKPYNLVWYWEEDNGVLWIIHCHRVKIKKQK